MTIPIQLDNFNALIKATELANRSETMQAILCALAEAHAAEIRKGKIKIIEGFSGSVCPVAVFINWTGTVESAPIDPLAISFYEYCPTQQEDCLRREKNPKLREGLEIRGPLALVDKLNDSQKQISKAQLIAIQTLIGNDSTWWPVTDYSDAELVDVFGGLELNVVVFQDVPIGIAHLDYAELDTNKAVKIVFIGIDPMMQGKGLGTEILHEVMSRAMDRGAEKIYLDTVSHRDIRTNTSAGTVEPGKPQGSAHDVYLKSGFKMVDVKLIDPANKKQLEKEGLAINQLNGPLEYRMNDLAPLRAEVDDCFGVSASKRQALSELI